MKMRLGILMVTVTAFGLFGCGRTAEPEASASPAEASAPPAATVAAPPANQPTHTTYAVEWVSNDIPQSMKGGVPSTVHVTAKNTGDWLWPDRNAANPSKPDGTFAVRLAYRWSKTEVGVGDRADLTASVPPGETANFTMQVTPPKERGVYELHVGLVQEFAASFSAKGAKELVVPVTVQ